MLYLLQKMPCPILNASFMYCCVCLSSIQKKNRKKKGDVHRGALCIAAPYPISRDPVTPRTLQLWIRCQGSIHNPRSEAVLLNQSTVTGADTWMDLPFPRATSRPVGHGWLDVEAKGWSRSHKVHPCPFFGASSNVTLLKWPRAAPGVRTPPELGQELQGIL